MYVVFITKETFIIKHNFLRRSNLAAFIKFGELIFSWDTESLWYLLDNSGARITITSGPQSSENAEEKGINRTPQICC